MRAIYWLLVRARARYLWKRGRINIGEFYARLEGSPAWLDQCTAPCFSREGRAARKYLKYRRLHG